MNLLIAGLVLWAIAHLFKRLAPEMRASMDAKLGAGPSRGLMSLLILASVALMVVGYRAAPVEFVFDSPGWMKHLNNTLMLVSVLCWVWAAPKGGRALGCATRC